MMAMAKWIPCSYIDQGMRRHAKGFEREAETLGILRR